MKTDRICAKIGENMANFLPKYYANQLIINPQAVAGIAIATGWTKKEEIWKNLSESAKQKVSVAGQLYSKEGINFIIRNLFLNPQINYLIVAGRDLSGSIKEFKSFLSGDKKNFLHGEIPPERIKEFIDYFSKNSLFVEEAELESALKSFDASKLPEKWTENPIDFPDHLAEKADVFPSEKAGFRIEGKKVSEVWLKVLDRILKFGHEKMSSYGERQKELIDVMTIINGENPDEPFLPEFLYFNQQDLLNYYPQMMTDKVFEGVEYTYGSRLRNHKGINQIQGIIEELKKENFSRRAIAFTWDVEKDHRNPKSPCLDLIQMLVQDGVLYFTAYIRSNDMYRAWPQNAFGLLKIQKEIAGALGMIIDKLIIISCSAHIYERDFLEAGNIIKENKPELECAMDPRGNFVIEVKNGEIAAKHIDSQGVFIQEFKGKTAREIRDKISAFVFDTAHALYLGEELLKAEQALKSGAEYLQT